MPARGTSQFGDDIIVGSPEYWKKWREKNKDKNKLAQTKYRNKQKELMMAARLSMADGIPVEQALAEVQGKAAALVEVNEEYKREGRYDTAVSLNPVVVDDVPPVDVYAAEARVRGVPYAVVKAEYEAVDRMEKELQEAIAKRGTPLDMETPEE